MERGEETSLGPLNELLYPRLQTEPLELARDQLVASHHRIYLLHPIGSDQRTAASLLRFKLFRILKLLVVRRQHGIVGNVNMYNLARFQLVVRQLVHLQMEIDGINGIIRGIGKCPGRTSSLDILVNST